MQEIKLLMEHIADELEDAETYARLALEYKDTDAETAKLFEQLSEDEMTHMNALHKAAVRLVNEYKTKNGEPPAAMLAVYNYLHEQHISKAQEVKSYQALYREM